MSADIYNKLKPYSKYVFKTEMKKNVTNDCSNHPTKELFLFHIYKCSIGDVNNK